MQKYREWDISPWGMIGFALALLVLPLRWLAGALVAAAFHEFCHWAAVRTCGGHIGHFCIGTGGAVMSVDNLSRVKELICTLAGPLGGAALLFVGRWFPCTAVCACVYSVYNLLPLHPLDGGRALRCAAAMLWPPQKAERLVRWTERTCIALIVVAAVYVSAVFCLGWGPVLLAASVILRKNTLQTGEFKSTIDTSKF